MFTYLKPLELEVPIICLATGCVSGRRDRRYLVEQSLILSKPTFNLLHEHKIKPPPLPQRPPTMP
jgi:hypothetical protein